MTQSALAIIVLDSAPLSILCHPKNPPQVAACRQWLLALQNKGHQIVLPEIVDYETRREFVRMKSGMAVTHLDNLGSQLTYLPLTTTAMRLAADLWAQVRNSGLPTASSAALDGDAILAAQALTIGSPVVVATSNPAHLTRFVPALDWQAIKP